MTNAETPMKVLAILPYFGGKRTMAACIVTELGRHTQFFEPFCGSMAVLFAKEPSQKETVNDLHGDLVSLARVVQSEEHAVALYDRLQRVVLCEDLLDQARFELDEMTAMPDRGVSPTMLDRAYWFFIASWMARNGTAGTSRVNYQIAVRWTNSGGSPSVRWRNAVESMPAWHRRLRNVVILRRDAFKILDRFEDSVHTAIYADPPYVAASRSGFEKNKGENSRYLHEFSHQASLLEADDHARLRDILGTYKKARVVISYYDCPRVRELYAGWTIIEHTRQKHLHAQNGRGHRPKEAPELLILNGPSYATGAQA